ncbi:MAG: exodeoxyribonuclease III, partial [Candidatus Falkowbacteria bacterium]|nr:exodeoxyribonuclease III [Candidatus Falkowbacteria bacterium]
MKIISWNVNGIRAVAKKGLADFLRQEQPDIIGLQETKISDAKKAEHDFDLAGYQEHFFGAQRPGYSGTALLVKDKVKVLALKNGFGLKKFDIEGRTQVLELEKFYLVNVYFPNSNHELSRLPYKIDFNSALLKYLKKLVAKKPVVLMGDFNVAHEAIDLARPKDNEGNAGFTPEEREDFSKFLASGLIDSYRFLNGQKIQYSWWSFRATARSRNIGWRIDYITVSAKLKKHLKK